MSKSYKKTGLAALVQWGKAGPHIRHAGAGLFQAQLADAATFARVQGADSVADDDFVTRRQLLAAGGGATEPITIPALVNPASPINPAFGQRAIVEDGGGFGITFNLPAMTGAEALGGKRCSLVLPLGNPNQAVTVNAATGQAFIDPATGAQVSTVTYPVGTFGAYADLTWEAAPGAAPALPATVTPPLVPDTAAGPNFAPIPVTISGTGGTLPSVLNLQVTLSTTGGSINLTVNTATQPGGPGTAWTIQADIPASSLPPFPTTLDLTILDTSTFPSPTTFAVLLGAFGVNTAATPTQPPTDLWVFDESSPISGGARWDESLSAGPNTNGQSAYVTLEDQIVWSEGAPPLADPTQPPQPGGLGAPDPNFHPKASRSGSIAAGAGFTSLGSAIHTFTGFTASGTNNTIWMRWVGQRKRTVGGAGIGVRLAVLEEIWVYEFGVWSLSETITASVHSGLFRFQGSGASIFIQAADDPTFDYVARGVVEWSWIDGYPPS